MRARYRLVDLANGAVVLDATAGSDAGIDVVSSEYATVAAEQTAVERLAEVVADQIVARLATVRGAHRAAPAMKAAKGSIGAALDQPERQSASICSTAPTKPSRARLASGCSTGSAGPIRHLGRRAQIRSGAARRRSRRDGLVRRPRVIWIEPAGDEIADAVEALLDAPACESPVVAIAGALRKTSALLKLAESHPPRWPMPPTSPKAAMPNGW